MGGLSYRDAGVDIDAKNRAFDLMKGYVRSTSRTAGALRLRHLRPDVRAGQHRAPVLVASADGVGTKLKLAFALDKHDTVGHRHRQPLRRRHPDDRRGAALLPRLHRHGKLDAETVAEVIKGIAEPAARTAARSSAARPPRCPASTSPASTTWPASSSASSSETRQSTGGTIAAGDQSARPAVERPPHQRLLPRPAGLRPVDRPDARSARRSPPTTRARQDRSARS